MAVDRTEFAVLVGPFVPYPYAVFLKIFNVGVALKEPQKLVDDRLQMQFLGRKKRKTVVKIKAHLIAEDAYGARPRAVVLHNAFGLDAS